MKTKYLSLYPDTYYLQGTGALILIQLRYTAIAIGRSKKGQLRIDIASHYKGWRIKWIKSAR